MPFKSKAQRAYLYAKHPKVAAKFAEETPEGAKLPKKKSPWLGMGKKGDD